MRSKSKFLLLLLWLQIGLFATVELRTNTQFIRTGSGPQLISSLAFSIDLDDFFEATPETPVYVRVRFEPNTVTLAQTLVDVQTATTEHHPIYLALRLDIDQADTLVTANPDAIAITRWRQGENQFWLKVSQDTDQWLMVNGVPQAPDFRHRVVFHIGVSAEISQKINQPLFANQKSNRLANARNSGSNPVELEHVSTLLCINADGAGFVPYPDPNGMVKVSLISYTNAAGLETEPDLANVVLGDQSSANYSFVEPLGLVLPPNAVQVVHAPDNPGLGFCGLSGPEPYLGGKLGFSQTGDLPFFAGSEVELTVTAESNYGFPTGAPYINEIGQTGYLVPGVFFDTPFSQPGLAYCLDSDGVFHSPEGVQLTRRVLLKANQSLAQGTFEGWVHVGLRGTDCSVTSPEVSLLFRNALGPPAWVSSGDFVGTQSACGSPIIDHPVFIASPGQFAPYFFGQMTQWPTNPTLLQLVSWVNQTETL